jgi:large conductance mechanosensitive channel
MIKGFKDFILRGNVVELAIAVVIGTAFQALISSFTSAIITPVLASLGSPEVGRLGFYLRAGVEETFIDIGALINALIVFVITALVVYLVFVVPMNTYNELQAKRKGVKEDADAPAPTDIELLAEIRDLLKQRQV